MVNFYQKQDNSIAKQQAISLIKRFTVFLTYDQKSQTKWIEPCNEEQLKVIREDAKVLATITVNEVKTTLLMLDCSIHGNIIKFYDRVLKEIKMQ